MNIAFIPVRGGSKSIPKKNIKLFNEKPLVYWTAKAVQDSNSIEKCIIATDCDEIASTVQSFNFSKLEVFKRSAENASDSASTESVMLEFLKSSDLKASDLFCLLQATSPLTTGDDLDKAFKQLEEEKADSLLSGTITKRFFWNLDGTPLNYEYSNRPRRQDFEGTFMENGAFYINSINNIKSNQNRLSGKISLYIQDESKSIELDEPEDWKLAEEKAPPVIDNEVKLFISDVDGVMTDGGMYYSQSGDEMKKFNTIDGMGFEIIRSQGIKTAIITSEDTEIVKRRAEKLKVDFLVQGKRDGGKLESANKICTELGIGIENVAYIGDDINCKELLQKAGIKACPSSARKVIKSISGINIMKAKGGEGCVREFVEMVLNAKKK
jgi:YrbI family 3-deoxy-D-manno-octulosonate 8-phosphate phosphatase